MSKSLLREVVNNVGRPTLFRDCAVLGNKCFHASADVARGFFFAAELTVSLSRPRVTMGILESLDFMAMTAFEARGAPDPPVDLLDPATEDGPPRVDFLEGERPPMTFV
jgi:hypothetical protein